MHPAMIKAALEIAQYNQADVARQCGVGSTLVHDVIHSNRRSKKVELRIAAITGLQLGVLWPLHYGPRQSSQKKAISNTDMGDALRARAVG